MMFPKPAPRVPASERRRTEHVTARPVCRRATGLQKPAPGTSTRERRAKARREAAIVLLRKTEAKVRDYFRCQFPGCLVAGREHVEAAHLVNSGMGGRFSVGDRRGCFVTLCREHHQGPRSLHAGYIDVRPRVPEAGADGPLDWWTRERSGNQWTLWFHEGTTGTAIRRRAHAG